MITPRNILQHELIGLETKIICCGNERLVGAAGKIIDETQHTLTLLSKGKRRIVPKNTATFHISLPDGDIVEVQGQALLGRAEDRIGMRPRRS